MKKFEEYFVAIWCLFMPVTSLLIVPAVQGTIVPYMLGFASVGLVFLKFVRGEFPAQVAGYVKSLLLITMVWLALLAGSQLGDLLNPQLDLRDVVLISDDNGLLFRASLFTQSLYFVACVFITLYFRYFFRPEWMRLVLLGAWSFAIYGLYDWLFFFLFHTSGDFVSNRTFANGDHPGSWSQIIDFAGLPLLRLKSFLGEPSYVSAVVIPYIFFAMEARRRVLLALLLLTAVLSTSTTVYLGLAISVVYYIVRRRENRMPALVVSAFLAAAIVALCFVYPDVFRSLFQDKFAGDTVSGKGRFESMASYLALFAQFNPINWLFGIGFGYTYFSLPWSLTANVGLVGVGCFLFAFLKPIFSLPSDGFSEALRVSLFNIVVVIILTLSEAFIPTTWMFIGLAFWQLDRARQNAFSSVPGLENHLPQSPDPSETHGAIGK